MIWKLIMLWIMLDVAGVLAICPPLVDIRQRNRE